MKSRWLIFLAAILIVPYFAFSQNVKDCGTVADVDGNIYNTVVLGKQCWMKENLRVARYHDGRSITPEPQFAGGLVMNSNAGRLYTWFSVLDSASPTEETDGRVQGPCPEGWHVPSNFEWMNMEDFVGYNDSFRCGADVNYVAKALADSIAWPRSANPLVSECAISADISGNNATGFSVYPSGGFFNGKSFGHGEEAGFWTCSNGSDETAPIHFFYYENATVEINCTPKETYYSVRCVKNN